MKIELLLNLRKQERAGKSGNDSAFASTLFSTQSLQLLAHHRSSSDSDTRYGRTCEGARERNAWSPMNFGQWLASLSTKRASVGCIAGFAVALLSCCSSLAAILPPSGPSGQSVSLMWNASTDSEVAGYRVYYGTTRSNYTSYVATTGTNTSVAISGLTAGQTNYFAVKAYNAAGVESLPSNEIRYFVPGIIAMVPRASSAAPVKVQFPVAPNHWYEVQASTNLQSWTTIWTTSVATSNTWLQYTEPQAATLPQRYYRLVNH